MITRTATATEWAAMVQKTPPGSMRRAALEMGTPVERNGERLLSPHGHRPHVMHRALGDVPPLDDLVKQSMPDVPDLAEEVKRAASGDDATQPRTLDLAEEVRRMMDSNDDDASDPWAARTT